VQEHCLVGALQPAQAHKLVPITPNHRTLFKPLGVAQVVDTVELFSFKRQRKLSLRFLAAFLLRIDIQQQVPVHPCAFLQKTSLECACFYCWRTEICNCSDSMGKCEES
jgi:hypothetical protein